MGALMSGSSTTRGSWAAAGSRPRAALRWAVRAGVLLLVVGADCRSQVARLLSQASPVDGRAPEVAVRVAGQAGPVVPGGLATRAVRVQCVKPGGPDTVTLRWTPPAGATGLAFLDVQPDNPAGPAPYVFSAVAVSDVGDPQAVPSLSVAFAAPAPPESALGAAIEDCFVAVTPGGNEYAATFADTETGSAPPSAAGATAADAGGAGAALEPAPYRWWRAELSLTPASGVALSQTLCQEWAAFLQDPRFFVALRVPVQADAEDPRSAPLPLVTPEPGFEPPQVELRAGSLQPPAVFAAGLELRPDRLGLAAGVLPAAAGERWMTLGVAGEPPATCPEGLDGDWEVYGQLALDFGGAETSCSECVLQQYACWAGDAPPFFFADPTFAPAGVSGQSTVQRAGVTCAGPFPLRLTADPPAPPITLDGVSWLRRTGSSGVVKLAHTLRAWLAPGEETDVTLTVESARRIPWRLYLDANLTTRITAPVTISGAAQFDFWAAMQMPLGFKGPESIIVTAAASSAAGTATVADHLWAGAWTPPPPAPAIAVQPRSLVTGRAIVVSGTLPDGAYRLIAVPNGAFVPGECYGGPELAAVDVTVTDGTLPATEVWPSATVGNYDVLVLGAACAAAGPLAAAVAEGGSVVVAGDDCSAVAGVEVTVPPSPIRRYLRRR
jgi:hypothetical protein